MARRYRLIDIGANLTDSMYSGVYNGKKYHEIDLSKTLERGFQSGLEKIVITGCSLSGSKNALDISLNDDRLFSTIGCHPTSCGEFDNIENGNTPSLYSQKLLELANYGLSKKKIVAWGECGKDYDRLQFCSKEVQIKYFTEQILLAEEFKLPMFLHCRNSHSDFIDIIRKNRDRIAGGVVHSFDGTIEEANAILGQDLYIGLNGCSMRTMSNLDVIRSLPIDRIMIETDCPWCEVKPTHASWKYTTTNFQNLSCDKKKWKENRIVKGRNELCKIMC